MARESCRTSRRTCLTATLFTTNLTLTGLGLKPDRHGEMPATNSLGLGKASGTKIQFVPHSEGTPADRVMLSAELTAVASTIELCSMELVGWLGG